MATFPPSPPMQREPKDPYMAFQFRIYVGSEHGTDAAGGFTDVTGLNIETEVETLREGGHNNTDVTLPGVTKFPTRLVLKRGLGDPAKLWRWYQKVMAGAIAREDVMILMLAPNKDHLHFWVFSQACPIKWSGPELHSGTAAVAFESIELVHKGLLVGM